MLFRLSLLLAAAITMSAAPVLAQERNSFALGVNYTQRVATDGGAHGNGGIGISWRIGHSDKGWGWNYGLGWFETNVDRSIGGRTLHFGELTIRPIVGGYGYTHQISRRWFVTGDLVGGIAFATFELTPEASGALGVEGRSGGLDARTHVVPIVRPELRTWYDLDRRWGLTVGASYAVARPTVTLVTPALRETLHLRADTFSISGGIVYRIF